MLLVFLSDNKTTHTFLWVKYSRLLFVYTPILFILSRQINLMFYIGENISCKNKLWRQKTRDYSLDIRPDLRTDMRQKSIKTTALFLWSCTPPTAL